MYFVNQFIVYFIWEKTFEQAGVFIPKIFKDFIKVVNLFVILACIKHFVFNGDVLGIFTLSGLLALVLGYSAQMVLGDIFAGISLNMVKQFNSGDWIIIYLGRGADLRGKVLQVNSRYVQLLTLENNYLSVPNSLITKVPVLNLSQPLPINLVKIEIPISDPGSPDKVKSLIKESVLEANSVLEDPEPKVYLSNMRTGEFIYIIECFTKKLNPNIVIDEVLSIVWYKFKKADIKIHQSMTIVEEMPTLKEIMILLRQVDLLFMLNPQELKKLATESRILFFGPPERILKQGASNDRLYIICKGGVDIYVEINDSKSSQVASLKSGDYFGEMSLLTGEPCKASVYANSESIVLEINHLTMQHVFQKRPELMKKICEVMVRRKVIIHEFEEFNKSVKRNKKEMFSNLLSRIQEFFL